MSYIERVVHLLGIELRALGEADLDRLVSGDLDPDRLPYWAAVWPSAVALASRLRQERTWEGEEVLELGCGAGLVGLVLAADGAKVTQTDLFPEAVALAQGNALLNGLPTVRHVGASWQAWPLRQRWPVVVGSDLTYERRSHRALLGVLELALTPDGHAFLADPGRPMSLDFFATAEASGWVVEMEDLNGSSDPSSFLYRMTPRLRKPGDSPRAT